MDTMKKAVIYARVSSSGPLESRQNTDRQVADLKRYIAINNMDLVATYEEKMSGAKENRPILTKCVEYCIANHIHTLCVSEISRLGRSTKIVVNTIDELTKVGIKFIFKIYLSAPSTPIGSPTP